MSITFRKATKKKRKLRLALIGPSGSGKTYSALSIASGLSRQDCAYRHRGKRKGYQRWKRRAICWRL